MAGTPLIPVILCGGTGTRLWPLSRASYPKQYWPLSGEGDATLMQQTQQRLEGLDDLEAPLLICNEDHRFIVAEQMRQIGIEPNAILLFCVEWPQANHNDAVPFRQCSLA